ncbi:beta-lactamase family protein [Algoriphagus sp. AGSA1]|nr:beta-lactamase family protein [Algoriphagus sp. AGSA1]
MEKADQFVIGSISKQITSVLVLREYEKGNLSLNDKIATYLPSIDQSWSKSVTIHHLLTHTHGVVDVNQPLGFEPGAQFQYSQLGFASACYYYPHADLSLVVLENTTRDLDDIKKTFKYTPN